MINRITQNKTKQTTLANKEKKAITGITISLKEKLR